MLHTPGRSVVWGLALTLIFLSAMLPPIYKILSLHCCLQFFRELVIRRGQPEGRSPTFMVDLITSYHAPDRLQSVVATLQDQVPTVKALVNTVAADSTSRKAKTNPISGPHFLRETLCGLDFRVSPRSFFQTNTRQTEVLYSIVALCAGESLLLVCW